jgi:hypothetical protein
VGVLKVEFSLKARGADVWNRKLYPAGMYG